MEVVLCRMELQLYIEWKYFHCRMEVSIVEWNIKKSRIAVDGPYGLPYYLSLSFQSKSE